MTSNSKLVNIPIDSIIEPEDQVRTDITLEVLQGLADSIKQHGIVTPLIVLEKGDKYEVVAGHRRYLASKMVNLSVLPCIVRELDQHGQDMVKLHENFFREDVNPIDEARYFVHLHLSQNLAYSEIARLCSRSDSYINSRVALLQGGTAVLAALEAGQINFSQANEINKATSENVRAELLRITIESGATVSSLRIMRYDYEGVLRNQTQPVETENAEPGSYPDIKHLIGCPVCKGNYPVQLIYPVSMCKGCYDGFLTGLKEADKVGQE